MWCKTSLCPEHSLSNTILWGWVSTTPPLFPTLISKYLFLHLVQRLPTFWGHFLTSSSNMLKVVTATACVECFILQGSAANIPPFHYKVCQAGSENSPFSNEAGATRGNWFVLPPGCNALKTKSPVYKCLSLLSPLKKLFKMQKI